MEQLLLASRLGSIDSIVENTNKHGYALTNEPENTLTHPSIWRSVQVHARRARARYRQRTLIVKEKMICYIQMLEPSA
jgi:hypothetical protein